MLHRNCRQSSPPAQNPRPALRFRLDKRDVCCRPTAYSRHPPVHARTASASVFRPPRRVGAGKAVFGLGPTLQLAVEAGCGGGAVPGRGAPLPIGAIRHLLDKMRSAGFTACSLPSNIGGNRSRPFTGRGMIRPKRSNATRGGLERLPTRKPLQLSTVTGSSEGALVGLLGAGPRLARIDERG